MGETEGVYLQGTRNSWLHLWLLKSCVGVQAPVSFTGTILDVKKTHVSVVLNDNKSMQLASFIQGELVFLWLDNSSATS